jgi:hypothetical protein
MHDDVHVVRQAIAEIVRREGLGRNVHGATAPSFLFLNLFTKSRLSPTRYALSNQWCLFTRLLYIVDTLCT